VKFIIDKYGMSNFKKLYEKSAPDAFVFDDIYNMSFDKLLKQFIDYERKLTLDESIRPWITGYGCHHNR